MTKKNSKPTPSLLEPQSTGGEIAQKGFTFQDGVLLSQLPKWLAQEGFTAIASELIGDIEIKFFIPGQGMIIDLWEAKDHRVTPAEFWDEINRFKEIHAGCPSTYRSFTLASVGISPEIESIEHALRRVREPYDFYGSQSSVINNTYKEFEQRVANTGHSVQDARFLFDHVRILPNFSLARNDAEALFRQGLDENLPRFEDLTSREIGLLFSEFESRIKKLNEPVFRIDLEASINDVLKKKCPPEQSISLHTSTNTEICNSTDLCFQWNSFFGGEKREYPTPEHWNAHIIGELVDTISWIKENRKSRRISLSGSRRLSTSLAIGSIFSAVSGFAIDLIYRNEIWSTDSFPNEKTPPYKFTIIKDNGISSDLVIVIGIARDIKENVKPALPSLNLGEASILSLNSSSPILSPEHTNVVVNQLKLAITTELSKTSIDKIHLFFAGPSHLALFLGHRLNATAPVQCYEWSGACNYTPTCLLFDQ